MLQGVNATNTLHLQQYAGTDMSELALILTSNMAEPVPVSIDWEVDTPGKWENIQYVLHLLTLFHLISFIRRLCEGVGSYGNQASGRQPHLFHWSALTAASYVWGISRCPHQFVQNYYYMRIQWGNLFWGFLLCKKNKWYTTTQDKCGTDTKCKARRWYN